MTATLLRSAAGKAVPCNMQLYNLQDLGAGGCSAVMTAEVFDHALDPMGNSLSSCVAKLCDLGVQLCSTGTGTMSGQMHAGPEEQLVAQRVVASGSFVHNEISAAAAPGLRVAAADAGGAWAAFEGSRYHILCGLHAGAVLIGVADTAVPADLKEAALTRIHGEQAAAKAHLQAMGIPAAAAQAQVEGGYL